MLSSAPMPIFGLPKWSLSTQGFIVILQQFDEFLETYGIKKGDRMYLAPEDRIIIW